MFQKESSCSVGNRNNSIMKQLGKKEKKKLRDAMMRLHTLSDIASITADPISDTATTDTATSISLLIDEICMEGTISVQTIRHDKLGKVQLFYKHPTTTATTAITTIRNRTPTESNNNHRYWPFSKLTQCIWMTVEDNNNNKHNHQQQHAPTPAFLSVIPNAIPIIYIPSHISKYICRGAHLMRAGMTRTMMQHTTTTTTTNYDAPFPNHGIVAICVEGNPQPFCVGKLTENTTPTTIGPGSIGVGVEIWSTYGDELWKTTNPTNYKFHHTVTSTTTTNSRHDDDNDNYTGASSISFNQLGGGYYDNGHYGNVGFIEGKIVQPIIFNENDNNEQPVLLTGQDDETMTFTTRNNKEKDDESQTAFGIPVSIEECFTTEPRMTTIMNDLSTTTTTTATTASTTIANDTHETIVETETETETETENPHNVLLHQALCKALVTIKDKDLPMPTSIFYANHVLPSRPLGTTIELKKTKWKKFGLFLLEMQRQELVTVAPDLNNKNNAGFLQSVNRHHQDLRGIKKNIMAVDTKNQLPKMSIVSLYIIPNHFVDLLNLHVHDVKATNAKSEDRRGTGFLTQPEVKAILENYLMENELIQTNQKSKTAIDAPLTAAMFKKDPNPPMIIPRKDLNELWVSKMEHAYALVEMPGSKILQLKRGLPPKVLLEVEKRQNKKFITRVRGLEDFGVDPESFCQDVAKRFACSGTVETDVGRRAALKKNHVELVFQGHLVDELCALLLGNEKLTAHGGAKGSDYSLPKESIEVELKKGVTAKKVR